MATTICSQCNASYPTIMKACPSCKTAPSGPKISSADIKKYIPLIMAVDALLIGGFLIYFFVIR